MSVSTGSDRPSSPPQAPAKRATLRCFVNPDLGIGKKVIFHVYSKSEKGKKRAVSKEIKYREKLLKMRRRTVFLKNSEGCNKISMYRLRVKTEALGHGPIRIFIGFKKQ